MSRPTRNSYGELPHIDPHAVVGPKRPYKMPVITQISLTTHTRVKVHTTVESKSSLPSEGTPSAS